VIPITYGPGRMRMKASLRNQLVDALVTSRLNVGGGNCLTVAGVHTISTLPRCIKIGTPLKQRIPAIPETLILPTGPCLAGVHTIGTLPRCIRIGTPLKQRILATPETVNSGTAFFINHRCIKIGTPLKQLILAILETLILPTGDCLTFAGFRTVSTLPRCIRTGTPLKQRILAIPETLILPTGNCLTVARVHTINTLPRCSRAGILLFTSHWVDGAGYTSEAARRCRGGVSVGSFASNPGVDTC